MVGDDLTFAKCQCKSEMAVKTFQFGTKVALVHLTRLKISLDQNMKD